MRDEKRLVPCAYLVKYALTSGVQRYENAYVYEITGSLTGHAEGHIFSFFSFPAGAWFEKKEDAIAAVKVLQARKIKSLEKQLDKLRKLDAEALFSEDALTVVPVRPR